MTTLEKTKRWFKTYYYFPLIALFVILVATHIYVDITNKTEGGKRIKIESTKAKLVNKILDSCFVKHSIITFIFKDGSNYRFGYLPFKKGVLSEIVNKGDTINKDSNSDKVTVYSKNGNFSFYIVADTNLIAREKKNKTNNSFTY